MAIELRFKSQMNSKIAELDHDTEGIMNLINIPVPIIMIMGWEFYKDYSTTSNRVCFTFTIVVNRSKKNCSILCGQFNPNHSCFDLQILMKCQMSFDFFILITRSVMQKKHELSVASCFMRIVLFLYFVAPQITYVYREWPCFWLNSMRGANRIHFRQNKGRFLMRYKVLSLIPLL